MRRARPYRGGRWARATVATAGIESGRIPRPPHRTVALVHRSRISQSNQAASGSQSLVGPFRYQRALVAGFNTALDPVAEFVLAGNADATQDRAGQEKKISTQLSTRRGLA
jgi:hypothetical protein